MYKMKNKLLSRVLLCSILATGFYSVCNASETEDNDESKLQGFVLDPVVVVGSRIPTSITESKADVSVVTREKIEEMHIDDVEEALRTVPGVQFLNYGANGANANLSGIRINGSNDVVILVDGVRINDFQGSNSSGYMYASLLSNMDNIERIEVLRGAAGTLYGSGAKGGVINIITRKINGNNTTIDIANGSFDKEAYKFNTQGNVNKVGYNIYYNKSLVGDTKDGDGNTWEGFTNTKNAGAKFIYSFSDDNKLTLSYDEIKSRYGGTDYIYKGPYVGIYESKALTLQHNVKLSDKWSNDFTYRKTDTVTNYAKAAENYGISSDYSYDFISDQVSYITDRNSLIFGMDYSKSYDNKLKRIGFDDEGNKVYGHRSMKNYSYYVQNEWEFIPRVFLTGGLRYDKPEVSSGQEMPSHTSKSYKLSWDVTDNDTVYAGRSDFYILPGASQLYDDEYGNENLKPAEGQTTSIGYSKKFDDYNILTFNWFKTESDTTIGWGDADGDGENDDYMNFSDAVSRGWNLQYVTQIGDNWSANLGWAHLNYHANGDNFEMGYYPKDLATFGITYTKDKLTAGIDGFYFMRKVNPNVVEKGWPDDNYGIYNLSVNYSPTKNLTFYTKVDNIFDTLWAEHTNVVHGGEPGSWYAMPGRSVVVGMQLKF